MKIQVNPCKSVAKKIQNENSCSLGQEVKKEDEKKR
jgi:hypothetical protein